MKTNYCLFRRGGGRFYNEVPKKKSNVKGKCGEDGRLLTVQSLLGKVLGTTNQTSCRLLLNFYFQHISTSDMWGQGDKKAIRAILSSVVASSAMGS